VKLNLKQSGSWIGMAGLAVTFFLYAASGLTAPLWAIVVLLLVWAVHFALGCRWFMTHPLRVLALPFVAAAIWFAAMVAGGAYLGWTA
jgi:hypothetical protein